MKIEKQIRPGLPQVGVPPYGQIHAHSTGNPTSTAQNEADYHMRRPVNSGFFSHVVGNGRVIQTAPVNRGAYDVGGGWNSWGYAHVELIESHKTQAEFDVDYKLYIELLRQLADEAGLPKTLDNGNTGIITHEYATYHQPNNKSDHVDPYPYLAKWGISRAQFKKDVENGLGTSTPSKPSAPSKPSKPSTPSKPSKPWKDVAEDGMWGNDLTRVLQQVYGSGTADGVISGQIKSSANQNVYAAKWGKGGSNLIRVFQMRLKAKGWYTGAIDGNLGPGTVKALQRAFGTAQDGIISPKSNMVNQNRLPF